MPVRLNGELYMHKILRSWYFFWNITRRQAISPIAKSHHMLRHDSMIQRVILIFIKCFSVNQNQLRESIILSTQKYKMANKLYPLIPIQFKTLDLTLTNSSSYVVAQS